METYDDIEEGVEEQEGEEGVGETRAEEVAEEIEPEEKVELPGLVDVVQIDGLALLKLIKHCNENMPEVVSGQLLGVDFPGRLEVTNCFPFPQDEPDLADYLQSMMKNLRKINVDCNVVGFYTSALLGTFLNTSTIEHLHQYQKEITNSVLVVYDPFSTVNGHLALKVYRLTQTFMERFSVPKSGIKIDENVLSMDILEELPVKVHNSHLIHGYLYELREEKSVQCEADRLNLISHSFLEKNFDILSALIDAYGHEQYRLQGYSRQLARQKVQQQQYLQKLRAENEARRAMGKPPVDFDVSKNPLFKPLPKPSKLEFLLTSRQMSYHCDQINRTSTQGMDKLFVIEGLVSQQQQQDQLAHGQRDQPQEQEEAQQGAD